MSSIRSRLFFGCPLIGAGVIAMVGAGASCADSGINLTPGNNERIAQLRAKRTPPSRLPPRTVIAVLCRTLRDVGDGGAIRHPRSGSS